MLKVVNTQDEGIEPIYVIVSTGDEPKNMTGDVIESVVTLFKKQGIGSIRLGGETTDFLYVSEEPLVPISKGMLYLPECILGEMFKECGIECTKDQLDKFTEHAQQLKDGLKASFE